MSGTLDRRAFIVAAPLVASVVACGGRGRAGDGTASGGDSAGAAPTMPALGVQLYTVRSAMAEDADATLTALAEMGYRNIELAGLYGMTPETMRAKLDAAGLSAVSSHNSLAEIRGDWPRTLESARTLGRA